MILRKEPQIVAYLINKRIDFKPFNHTLEVDECKLDEHTISLLGEYRTEKEKMRPSRYKKRKPLKSKEQKELIQRQKNKRQFIEVMDNLDIEIIPYEKYKKLYPSEKNIIRWVKEQEVETPFKRHPSEYSNTQWNKYYED